MSHESQETYTQRVYTILVVDDDATVRGVVADYLQAAGHDVTQANDGKAGFDAALTGAYDLVILDVMLPRLDGLEVFRRLRAAGHTTPVIILTAKGSETDRILGLELGADDYVTKPFSPRELVLRVEAVLRRGSEVQAASAPSPLLEDGNLRVDTESRKVFIDGEELVVTLREFDLLAYVMSNPNVVMSRDELLEAVWGWQFGDSATVTVHVRRLREKIEIDPAHPTRLVTVWGRGYRWEPAVGE